MTIVLVWLHIVAVVAWIGGMMFLSLVLVPEFRRAGLAGERLVLFRDIARRFRMVVWAAMGLLITTGVVLMAQRDLSIGGAAAWPRPLQVKLTLVICLVGLSLWHDVTLASRTRQARAPSAAGAASVDRRAGTLARLVPRLALLLALAVVFSAVVLVRS